MQNTNKDFNEMIKKYADELLSYSKKSTLKEKAGNTYIKSKLKRTSAVLLGQSTDKATGKAPQSEFDDRNDLYKKIAEQNRAEILGENSQKSPDTFRFTASEANSSKEKDVFYNDGYKSDQPRQPSGMDTDIGLIRVHVYTGCLYFPVDNAKVTIYKTIGGEEKIINVMYTDFNGRTRETVLPAPKSYCDEEGEFFETYNIRVEAKNFQTAVANDIKMYPNAKSIVQIELLTDGLF